MSRTLLRTVLAAFVAAIVLLLLTAAACGIIQGELALAATMKFAELGKALGFAFVAFLFVVATGLLPSLTLKWIGIRNALAYLFAGAVSGLVAERCYFLEMDVWDSWDFSAPQFVPILTEAIRETPSFLAGTVQMLPHSAIPVGVGVLCSAVYWLISARRARP